MSILAGRTAAEGVAGALASAADSGAILEVLKSEDVARLAAQPPQEQQQGEQREAYDVF